VPAPGDLYDCAPGHRLSRTDPRGAGADARSGQVRSRRTACGGAEEPSLNGVFVVSDRGLATDVEVTEPVWAALSRLARTTPTTTGMVQGLCVIARWACVVDVAEVMIDIPRSSFVPDAQQTVVVLERWHQEYRQQFRDPLGGQAAGPEFSSRHSNQAAQPASFTSTPGPSLRLLLAAEGRALGMLTLRRSRRQEWTVRELVTARLLADVIASYLALTTDLDSVRTGRPLVGTLNHKVADHRG
jgi:hypothetical protein